MSEQVAEIKSVRDKFCECGCGKKLPRGRNWRRNRFVHPHQYQMGTINVAKRFWSKVKPPVGIGECWIWMGAKWWRGYGTFSFKNHQVHPHRFAYEQIIGQVPEGLELDHLCQNPSCVNPYHLEPVTHRENCLRGDSPAARHAKRTHCKNGHELVAANLDPYELKRGGRSCRICKNARSNADYHKRHRNCAS